MVLAAGCPEVIHMIKQPFGVFGYAVLERRRTPCTMNGSFSRRTVVACDVHEQGVVGLAHFFNGIEHAANLCIGVRHETCKDFHKSRGDRLVAVRVFLPRWHFIRPRCECGSFGNHTKSQLTFVNLTTQCIPALVELALELVNPFGRHMMRAMHRTCGDISKKWLFWLRCLLHAHP